MGLFNKINQARSRFQNKGGLQGAEVFKTQNVNTKVTETKASSVAPLVAYNTIGRPVWTPRNYEALSKQGYQKNVIVYRCVNLIARNLASVPLVIKENGCHLETHPVLDLLRQPNPHQSGIRFLETVVANLLLSGNSYIEHIGSGDHQELHVLRPDRIQIIPEASGLVAGYKYSVDGQQRILQAEDYDGHKPILHIKTFHPLDDWYGMSPVEAAACAIDQHNTVASHNLSILQNGGRPSGALMIDTKARGYDYTQEELEDLRRDLRAVSEGHQNAGRIMMLQGDFHWQEMGLSPKDMDFIDGKILSAREIAQAFNVPAMLAGVPGDATFANFKEARYHLWEDTILPLLSMVLDEFTTWMCPKFEGDFQITYRADAIPALDSKRDGLWDKISKADFLTVTEKRAALGYGILQTEDNTGENL